jgi:hypothetical protein
LMEIDHDLVLPHVLRILPELLRVCSSFSSFGLSQTIPPR